MARPDTLTVSTAGMSEVFSATALRPSVASGACSAMRWANVMIDATTATTTTMSAKAIDRPRYQPNRLSAMNIDFPPEGSDHLVVEVRECLELLLRQCLEHEADHRGAFEEEVVAVDSLLARGWVLEAVEVEVARQSALVHDRRLGQQP